MDFVAQTIMFRYCKSVLFLGFILIFNFFSSLQQYECMKVNASYFTEEHRCCVEFQKLILSAEYYTS